MSVTDSEKECPLCMEVLDWDDLGFYPCSCGYQICRFCWHRLRTDENGLCPACRQAFPDIPVSFNPEISAEELKKQQKRRNKERKSNKDPVFKPQDLATLRVVQKNLVFVIGLSSRLTQEDLKKEFAHFGKIIKFVHNKSTAYITYSKPEEAIRAIRTLNASAAQESAAQQLQLFAYGSSAPTSLMTPVTNNNVTNLNMTSSYINATSAPTPTNRLKASLGTTKYCNHFLRSQQCPKVGECMYLHEIAEAEASFTKEQMQAGKHVEYEKKLMDSYSVNLPPPQPSLALQQQLQLQQPQPQLQPPQPLQQQQTQQPLRMQPQQTQPQLQQPQPTGSPQASIMRQPLFQSSPQPNQPTPFQQLLQQQQQQQQQQSPQQPESPQQQQQPQPQQIQLQTQTLLNQSQQLQQQQQQQQQLELVQQQQQELTVVDTDSEDDGLDFDPISVSTSGLRDLLEQQVQQAKQQLQMQNYLQQQLSSNPSLASVLFQQNNRLNLNGTAQANRLIVDAGFNGLNQVPTLASLADLSDSANQQEQVSWPNLGTWTNFLQRSGYGFENGS